MNENIKTAVLFNLRGGVWETYLEMQRRVYDTKGLSPTIRARTSDIDNANAIKVLEENEMEIDKEPIACEIRTDEGIRTFSDNVMGTLRTIDACGGKHVIEPNTCLLQPIDRDYNKHNGVRQEHIEMKDDGISHALRTGGQLMLGEPNYELSDKMKKYINSKDDKYKVNETSLKVNRDVACSKTTREGSTRADASDYIEMEGKMENNQNIANVDLSQYRIRKLTPKECFRLMGVKDEDYKNVAKHQSNASLYHLAGDSICVPTLMAIFSGMIDVNWKEKLNYTEWWINE